MIRNLSHLIRNNENRPIQNPTMKLLHILSYDLFLIKINLFFINFDQFLIKIWLKCQLKDKKWSNLIEKVQINQKSWYILLFLIFFYQIQSIFNLFWNFWLNPELISSPRRLLWISRIWIKNLIKIWFNYVLILLKSLRWFNRLSFLST